MFECIDTWHVNVTTLRLANRVESEGDVEILTAGFGTGIILSIIIHNHVAIWRFYLLWTIKSKFLLSKRGWGRTVVVRLPWQRYLPASEVLSGEKVRVDRLRLFTSSPMVTFSHWAVGVRDSPGNLDTEQVTMYGCPISGSEGLGVLTLALIGCWGTVE